MPEVSVIVPARNAAQTIRDTLDGLLEQDYAGEFETIIVDDGSTDATAELAARSALAPMVLRRPRSGPALSRNVGAAAARADRLAFLDSDCRPTAGWLSAGVRALRAADFVQGATGPADPAAVGPFDRTLWVREPSGLYESANLFVARKLFERIGGFESWLVPRRGIELGEDVWLGCRARRAGARLGFSEEALVHHAVFPRGPFGFVAERARLRFFPAMAARMPELRREFLYLGLFHSRRSAALDLALTSLAVAVARGSRLAALGVLPYAAVIGLAVKDMDGAGALRVTAAGLAADAVGLTALAYGSLVYGSPVL